MYSINHYGTDRVKVLCYNKQLLISIKRDMARAYAIELRLRVIKAVEAGIRISKVSKLFNVSRDGHVFNLLIVLYTSDF